MINNLPYLINLPPFIFRGVNVDEFSFLQKIFFILKGKIVSIIINNTNEKIFCKLINSLFRDSDISYRSGLYIKNYKDLEIYFPNKRILRLVNNPELSFDKIYHSYCIEKISFSSNDVIVDCGANVGELNLALALRGVDIHYIGFEPDEETFKCLELNNKNMNSDLYNLALSNISGESNLYLDNEGGNSSLVDFGTESNVIVETRTLDSFNFEKIKLLKIDAEGFEPEVLEGAKESLENIEFISIDFGGERGPEQKKTIVSVNRFLYKNDYQLIEFSDYRFIGLYKNNRI